MISIKVRLSTGQEFNLTENPSTNLQLSLNKLFQKEHISYKINYALCEAKKIYLEKTIQENNLHNNAVLVLIVGDISSPIEKGLTEDLKKNIYKCLYFLLFICKLPLMYLDGRGNTLPGDWVMGRKNGPPGYLKEYYPPEGWIGIGLRVLNLFDNGDNKWLGDKNQEGEWYTAYHAIKKIDIINNILFNGFRRGAFQEYKNCNNINPLNNILYPKCGEGAYFIPNFAEAEKYAPRFTFGDNKYRLIFMCRVNPHKVRIAKINNNLESWIVNGDSLDDQKKKKRDDEVRIYRILMKIE